MSKFDNTTVTYAGRRILAFCLANNNALKFSHIAVGDGEAPHAPEELTELVSHVLDADIVRLGATVGGITTVRGSFRSNSLTRDFYLREIGIFVLDPENDSEPILFAYANAADTADLVPMTGGASQMEEVLNLSIVVGNAKVMIKDIDPNALATIEDITQLELDLNIEEVRDNINDLKEGVEQLREDYINLRDDLEEAAGGFVAKIGDTMVGDLVVPNVLGHLEGSADEWGGWCIFSTINEIDASASLTTFTILSLVERMPDKSRLVTYINQGNSNMPHLQIGMLEIIRYSRFLSVAQFQTTTGQVFNGTVHDGSWKGWVMSSSVPTGTILTFGGNSLPMGYYWCHGEYKDRTQHAALFAAIGTTYGTSVSTNFRLPDVRGHALRYLDQGAGIDSGRTLGSKQEPALPNITGCYGSAGDQWGFLPTTANGAFYMGASRGRHRVGGGGADNYYDLHFSASHSNSIYGRANDVRMRNIALNAIIKY